jgi:hypothetical protein
MITPILRRRANSVKDVRNDAGYAYAHPDQASGMVFVETPNAIVARQAPPWLLNELKCTDRRRLVWPFPTRPRGLLPLMSSCRAGA